MKKIILIALVLAGIYYLSNYTPQDGAHVASSATTQTSTSQSPSHQRSNVASIADAYAHHLENVRVEDQGAVVRVMADDTQGSRHQRFLVRVSSGTTVLIAHNIDLAPRIANLRAGDQVRFAGEYVWNEKGGIVHWTHRDPSGHHAAGWIESNGQTYR